MGGPVPPGASFISPAGAGRPVAGSMESVYLLVLTEVGRLEEVLRKVEAIPEVAEVQAVTGPFDLIVKVQAPHINQALDVVMHRIRKIPGIKGTETLVRVAGPT